MSGSRKGISGSLNDFFDGLSAFNHNFSGENLPEVTSPPSISLEFARELEECDPALFSTAPPSVQTEILTTMVDNPVFSTRASPDFESF